MAAMVFATTLACSAEHAPSASAAAVAGIDHDPGRPADGVGGPIRSAPRRAGRTGWPARPASAPRPGAAAAGPQPRRPWTGRPGGGPDPGRRPLATSRRPEFGLPGRQRLQPDQPAGQIVIGQRPHLRVHRRVHRVGQPAQRGRHRMTGLGERLTGHASRIGTGPDKQEPQKSRQQICGQTVSNTGTVEITIHDQREITAANNDTKPPLITSAPADCAGDSSARPHSVWSYSCKICHQSVSAAEAASLCTALMAAWIWYGPGLVAPQAPSNDRLGPRRQPNRPTRCSDSSKFPPTPTSWSGGHRNRGE